MAETISRKTAILQSLGAIGGMLLVLVLALFVWAMLNTPDSGIGSDAYQMGQEEASYYDDEFYGCSEANARDSMGGSPSRQEIDDWTTGCLVGPTD